MKSGFFNSNITGYDDEGMPIFDRAQEASFFAKYFSSFIGNGIYPNPSTGMQILEDSGMNVRVSNGCCFINGYFGWIEEIEPENLTIQASENLPRIDRVVARLNLVERFIELNVKKGTASSNPIAPDIERSLDYYEIALADIRVNANVGKITQANITDLRLNNSLCGIVSGVIDQVDTTTIFNQFKAWYEETTQQASINIEAILEEFQNGFNEWFEHIKGQLSEDAAGHLQLQIDEIVAEQNKLKDIVMDAISPIMTESEEILATETGEYIVAGM